MIALLVVSSLIIIVELYFNNVIMCVLWSLSPDLEQRIQDLTTHVNEIKSSPHQQVQKNRNTAMQTPTKEAGRQRTAMLGQYH